VAVFLVFSLLTVAVVASQARSTEVLRLEAELQAMERQATTGRQSLIVSHVGRFGTRLLQAWRH
jgi:hypothetical protein